MELLLEHLAHGLMLSLLLSMPAVLTAAGIGLVVGILQAVTQVQEQTIAAAPKILGVFTLIILGGGLMMTLLENYVRESVQIAFNEIPQDGLFVIPSARSQTAQQARGRAFFAIQAKDGANSEKLKAFSSQWSAGQEGNKSSSQVVGWPHTSGKGNALGVSEKMTLQNNR